MFWGGDDGRAKAKARFRHSDAISRGSVEAASVVVPPIAECGDRVPPHVPPSHVPPPPPPAVERSATNEAEEGEKEATAPGGAGRRRRRPNEAVGEPAPTRRGPNASKSRAGGRRDHDDEGTNAADVVDAATPRHPRNRVDDGELPIKTALAARELTVARRVPLPQGGGGGEPRIGGLVGAGGRGGGMTTWGGGEFCCVLAGGRRAAGWWLHSCAAKGTLHYFASGVGAR